MSCTTSDRATSTVSCPCCGAEVVPLHGLRAVLVEPVRNAAGGWTRHRCPTHPEPVRQAAETRAVMGGQLR